jgi:hypothetical protein
MRVSASKEMADRLEGYKRAIKEQIDQIVQLQEQLLR